MSQDFPQAAETSRRPSGGVPSPCISVCRTDPDSGCCVGCHRTLDEIARWSAMSDAERMDVWMTLPGRRARAKGE
jgi:predicted Fe-S protein YdhL (DUF1289 family)